METSTNELFHECALQYYCRAERWLSQNGVLWAWFWPTPMRPFAIGCSLLQASKCMYVVKQSWSSIAGKVSLNHYFWSLSSMTVCSIVDLRSVIAFSILVELLCEFNVEWRVGNLYHDQVLHTNLCRDQVLALCGETTQSHGYTVLECFMSVSKCLLYASHWPYIPKFNTGLKPGLLHG